MPRDYSCGAFWRKGGKPKDGSDEPPARADGTARRIMDGPFGGRRRDLRERFGDDQAVKPRQHCLWPGA